MCATCGCEGASDAGRRRVRLERNLLEKNDGFARANRAGFEARGILALNLVSSPGSGKTSLLVASMAKLQKRFPVAVIVGDQQTCRDADRLRAGGVAALQINTGKGCHLDARGVGRAVEQLNLPDGAVLLIENVGNLVCPAAFDLGETHKVVLLSITEGEDKPLKYPELFAVSDLMLLTKVDLLPHLEVDVDFCLACARRVHPGLEVIRTSAVTGEGFDAWLGWIEAEAEKFQVRLATPGIGG